ncbi:thermonuclease family protein [Sphingobacterium bovistauri]|uniref:Thermonuclease family protein n=1 Tax=Sphingobacterium bovistauri TaxID=2781959 RepID=A0ABS7Z3U3_9SPHI|nr:thermonuclease family protein [Sphingobacterium bovistauri]MCA5004845.1 thermonuclease family protein [Sphingobacterium bovistauri]
MMFRGFILFISSLLSFCESQHSTGRIVPFEGRFEDKIHTDPSIFKVDSLVDGDTFWVLDSKGERIKIRLIGVDAPEVKNVFRKKKHPFGAVSKGYVDSLLLSNRFVRLTFDVDSLDQYGRTLGYAYLNDGTFLNEHLIRQGYATLMTISPNIQYEEMFYEAQVYARENKLGIWKEED